MALYELSKSSITKIGDTSFSVEGIKERSDLQRLLRDSIEVISPETLVIAEEFCDWEDSRRRIDLLGIDKDANLVVIELKRTEDGGFMELQALRYAAMLSKMTFNKALETYKGYLETNGDDADNAESLLLSFLDWDEPIEDDFAQDVRIVLASAEFSKELTSTVMWLINHEIDVRCIRLRPYKLDNRVLLDVQQIIPLPEAADYQVQIREKAASERQSRLSQRDTTRYNLRLGDLEFTDLPKRRMVYQVVKTAIESGISPDDISKLMRSPRSRWIVIDGECTYDEFHEKAEKMFSGRGARYEPRRFFSSDSELFRVNGSTYALTKMWGRLSVPLVESILRKYPSLNGSFVAA